jgi:DNA-binding XRE family transcriptional regulator
MDQSDFIKRFGMRVKQLRKEKGLSYRTMAQLCDVDYSDISKIEKGQINITLGTGPGKTGRNRGVVCCWGRRI